MRVPHQRQTHVRGASMPIFAVFATIGAFAMFVPAIHALLAGDEDNARAFGYGGIASLLIITLVVVARANVSHRRPTQNQLLALLGAYVLLPIMLAIPFWEAVPNASFLDAYIEMVSSLTTTGATLFDPSRLSESVHLWRATVGWIGGLFIWVTAVAIMAPLDLGGFEVLTLRGAGRGASRFSQIAAVAAPSERLARFTRLFLPLYAGLTLVLWMSLSVAGERPFVALCHAMSTLSTSGITPLRGLQTADAGLLGEALVALFLVLALSRATFARDYRAPRRNLMNGDVELRFAAAILGVLTVFLFLRHFLGAADVDDASDLRAAFGALWGAFFTLLGFLSTAGWESSAWETARIWSGLQSPGLILVGVALMGGGVATTAGGVKLFRLYALYKQGVREMERLVRPSSIGGSGSIARRIRRQGAYVAWIFFMLFALAIAALTIALAATGIQLQDGLIYTVASLSNTGPLVAVASERALQWSSLGEAAKLIVAAGMVLGRMEMLAIVALLNPDLWRD